MVCLSGRVTCVGTVNRKRWNGNEKNDFYSVRKVWICCIRYERQQNQKDQEITGSRLVMAETSIFASFINECEKKNGES